MRRAIDIDTLAASSEEGVCDFRQSAIQRKMASQLNRCFRLVTICPAGSLELETAVIRDVYLLVRVIDQKNIGTDAETAEVRGRSELVKVRGGQPRLVGPLYYAARVDAVDAAAIVQVK